MLRIYYHASHEQFPPTELLSLAQAAESAGFDGVFSSDHVQPWSSTQGHSAFAWTWLGAALQATSRIPFALITTPLGLRYHPLLVAQAVGTLVNLYGDRFGWFAVGSGEALNEAAFGAGWPEKHDRNRRLRESVEIMRRLLRGERVTHSGEIEVEDGRLWCVPAKAPAIHGAALSEETANWMGSWTDGLLTAGIEPAKVAPIVKAYRSGGGEGKPVAVKVDLSWHESESQALKQAHEQWACNAVGPELTEELKTPEEFERHAASVSPKDIRECVQVGASLEEHGERLAALAAAGVDVLDLHNVGTNHTAFIKAFAPLLDELRKDSRP
jgi:probable non-F420 flavinoid oxidoreductase